VTHVHVTFKQNLAIHLHFYIRKKIEIKKTYIRARIRNIKNNFEIKEPIFIRERRHDTYLKKKDKGLFNFYSRLEFSRLRAKSLLKKIKRRMQRKILNKLI